VITAAIAAFGAVPWADAIVSLVVYGLLALFTYRGSRVAIILLMIVWTLDKALQLLDPAVAVTALVWWFAYLKVFLSAFQIETERKKRKVTA
jgi:hypothetical protein